MEWSGIRVTCVREMVLSFVVKVLIYDFLLFCFDSVSVATVGYRYLVRVPYSTNRIKFIGAIKHQL